LLSVSVGSVSSLEALSDRLKNNKVVSITVGMSGKRRITVPFMDSQICLATGAVCLALQTSAPILPTFTLRHSSGKFLTTTESELLADQDKKLDTRIEGMLTDFVSRIEPYLLRWPDQFPWRLSAWCDKEE
jgi:lauroyl/myristoyl acyltransferase